MKRAAVRLGCLIAVICLSAGIARADLKGDIETVLQDKLLQHAAVGIEIVRIGAATGPAAEIYQHDGRTPRTPASNLKLATTSAALDRFGPAFKFRTTLLLHDNNLVLIGDGDPSFGDAAYLKRVGWKTTTVYENWAAQLAKMNVSSIHDVIVDDAIFDDEFLHPAWPVNQIDHWYEAEVGGMNFNVNCIDFLIEPTAPGARVRVSLNPNTQYLSVDNRCVTGTNDVLMGRQPGTNEVELKGQASAAGPSPLQETIHDPPMYAATVLAEVIQGAGVKVAGAVKRDRSIAPERVRAAAPTGPSWKVIGIHETPIDVVLARANKDSINLYAESLCKRLGHETSGSAGSWASGTAAVGAFLKHAGVADSEFKLDDGSGMSKQNAISPHALVQVLGYDFAGRNHDAFMSSLSVAGVDGTLSDRFRGMKGRVIGKSGFVEGVSCLSGFLHARDGQWYAFSIMMNHLPRLSNTLAKTLQERIVRALDQHTTTAAARG